MNSEFGPFFPIAAERDKHLSKTQIGIVLTSTEVSCAFVSLFVTPRIGPAVLERTLIMSALLNALSSASFGLLFWVQNSTLFFTGCILMRIFLGASYACYWVSFVALATSWFPDYNSRIIGINESAIFIGQTIGPVLGNYLVMWHGYDFLFLIPSAISSLFSALIWFLVHKVKANNENRFVDRLNLQVPDEKTKLTTNSSNDRNECNKSLSKPPSVSSQFSHSGIIVFFRISVDFLESLLERLFQPR